MDTAKLIEEGIGIKALMDNYKKRLDEIKDTLVKSATFQAGKNTAYLMGNDGLRAKVINKTTESWDQNKLNTAREKIGDDTFLTLFNWEWKACGKREIDGFLKFAPKDTAQLILDAQTVKTSSSVTFERVEE